MATVDKKLLAVTGMKSKAWFCPTVFTVSEMTKNIFNSKLYLEYGCIVAL